MGNGGNIFDHADLQAGALQRTDRSLTAGARALNIDFYALHSMYPSQFLLQFQLQSVLRRGWIFLRAAEAQLTGARPGNCIALGIGNRYNRIIKCGLNMCRAAVDVLALTASADGLVPLVAPFLVLPFLKPLPTYFFLLAMVFLGPLRVLAFVLER